MKRLVIGSLVALCASVSVSEAQEAAPAPAASAPVEATSSPAPAASPTLAPAPTCELHVFPTLEGQAQTTGWLSGFGIIGAVADAAANKDRNVSEAQYLKEALGPRLQIEALKSVDVIGDLGMPAGTAVTFETPIADRKITTKADNRLTSSTAPCYAELLITENFYTKRALYGRSLNNRFIFKDFRTGKTKTVLTKGRGGNGLEHFPPKTTDETEVAETELRTVFAKNFTEYAKTIHPSK